jgi:hypothetical protein
MSDILSRIEKLKTKEEKLKSSIDVNKGALATHLKTLKDTFGCNGVEEAQKLAETYRAEIEAEEEEIVFAVKQIEADLDAIEE